MSVDPTPPPAWIATQATVTSCHYQSADLGRMAFGFSTREKLRITFDYYAHGQLYSGEFQSPVAVPQNESIPITYNPLNPAQNSRGDTSSSSGTSAGPSLGAIGITGSIILSLAWLVVLHSCR